jgi:hypothetical protein
MSGQTVALGIGARIEQLRAIINRIRELKRQYRELELNPFEDPEKREQARVHWRAYEREFSWRYDDVAAVLDYFTEQHSKAPPAPACVPGEDTGFIGTGTPIKKPASRVPHGWSRRRRAV